MTVHQPLPVVERNALGAYRLAERRDQPFVGTRGRYVLCLFFRRHFVGIDRHLQHVFDEGNEVRQGIAGERIAAARHSHGLWPGNLEPGVGIAPPVRMAVPVGEVVKGIFASTRPGLFYDRRRDTKGNDGKCDFEHKPVSWHRRIQRPALIDTLFRKAHLSSGRLRKILLDLLPRTREITPQFIDHRLHFVHGFAQIEKQPCV